MASLSLFCARKEIMVEAWPWLRGDFCDGFVACVNGVGGRWWEKMTATVDSSGLVDVMGVCEAFGAS